MELVSVVAPRHCLGATNSLSGDISQMHHGLFEIWKFLNNFITVR
jgi:hypothetical protein